MNAKKPLTPENTSPKEKQNIPVMQNKASKKKPTPPPPEVQRTKERRR
jgi:hypothetical protein